MTTHYEFLERLHRELEPRGYLEIGVQTGASLQLASCSAFGIDPVPITRRLRSNELHFAQTSDEFFRHAASVLDGSNLDLIYIDGDHRYEYGLRDFLNVVKWANERTVIVFDDTHPYSQEIATREQTTIDWTGDVWKTMHLISQSPISWAKWAEVDVSPTGAFVVWDINPEGALWFAERMKAGKIETAFTHEVSVPDDIINRGNVLDAPNVVETITRSQPWLHS